ncbi:amidase [Roseateles cellulosilyticus]|uniref:Amidase n=1 Tax=Pelomonas cellulosilytica TaxID=2906762 RepID=A0ABS8XYI2_9BURK|nr:amidase family protein [Pelomonas sp. P8]MCE4557702.1 amidase [Pelomonas sp. P8]
MDFATYRCHDATSLAAEVAAGRVSPKALLDLALARLAEVQPALNPVCRLMDADARAQLARGVGSGPLAGVPTLIKDVAQDYAGQPTGWGSRAYATLPPPRQHAHAVRRLLEAGLVVFGKTNAPELGLKGVTDPQAYGPSRNPWDPGRTPGGSSGGAAVAVASGVVPMAAGNDGGGSLRIPAACCGLVGLKPSRGRVSAGPAQGEVWFGACSEGVISRSVRDTALALDILSGPEPGDPVTLPAPTLPFVQQLRSPLRRLRIAWCADSPIGEPVHDEARLAVERAVALLRGLGHSVEAAQPDIDGRALANSYLHLYFGQVPAAIANAVAQGGREEDFEPMTRLIATLGRATSAQTLTQELLRWNNYARGLAALHARYDLYLTPTLASPPVRHGTGDPPPAQLAVLGALRASGLLALLKRAGLVEGVIRQMAADSLRHVPFTQLANLTGTPAISVPLHWTNDGLPLGVQFVAAPGEDGLLLQLAAELETAQPWFNRLPPA